MKAIYCSCGKLMEGLDDGSPEVKNIQIALVCRDCRRNHACCVLFSPDHAVDLLGSMGYQITEPEKKKI